MSGKQPWREAELFGVTRGVGWSRGAPRLRSSATSVTGGAGRRARPRPRAERAETPLAGQSHPDVVSRSGVTRTRNEGPRRPIPSGGHEARVRGRAPRVSCARRRARLVAGVARASAQWSPLVAPRDGLPRESATAGRGRKMRSVRARRSDPDLTPVQPRLERRRGRGASQPLLVRAGDEVVGACEAGRYAELATVFGRSGSMGPRAGALRRSSEWVRMTRRGSR